MTFSQHLACPTCGRSYDEPAPRNFSFNSPYGACETCDGLGTTFEVDPELVIPDPDVSINAGRDRPVAHGADAVLHAHARGGGRGQRHRSRRAVGQAHREAAEGHPRRHGGKVTVKYRNRYGRQRQYSTDYEGVIPWVKRRHEGSESDWTREQYEGYMREVPCARAAARG